VGIIKTMLQPEFLLIVIIFIHLYQREGTYSGSAVTAAINSGMGIINHMGHTNYSILMGMSPNTPDSFINDEYGFIYTQGCYPAAFDDGTSGSAECVGERLVIAEHGPMAFVGNTRYGWYSPGSIEGTSEQFDRTFFDALFIENIRELGKANDYSKVALVSTVDSPWMRWCYYELILFGDPGTAVIMTDGEFPYVEVANIEFFDTSGDNDGIINPGEQIEMVVEIQNMPDWQIAENIEVEFICDSSFIVLQNTTHNYGSLAAGNSANNSLNPFIFTVSNSCGYEDIHFQLHITSNQTATYPFDKMYYDTFQVSLVQNNWPSYLGVEVKSSPIVIDFDNDGEDEIVTVDRMGNVYAITTDAQTKPVSRFNLMTRSGHLSQQVMLIMTMSLNWLLPEGTAQSMHSIMTDRRFFHIQLRDRSSQLPLLPTLIMMAILKQLFPALTANSIS